MFPYIEVFGFRIYMYGLFAVLGLAAAGLLVWRLSKRRKVDPERFFPLAIAVLIGLFVGAHLLFAITNIPFAVRVLQDFDAYTRQGYDIWSFLGAWFGGMVFYGGLLGGLAGGAIYAKLWRLDLSHYADVFVPAIPLFHAFGRVGCFLSGCCFGVECPIGWEYPAGSPAAGAPRFPVQLLESGLNLLLCAVLVAMVYKTARRGLILQTYLMAYSVVRFFDEFLRGDALRGVWGPFSTSQWISLALFFGVLVWMATAAVRRRGQGDKARADDLES